MYKPLFLCLGLRKVKTSFFTKLVAFSSQVGIALGVTTLIVVMSVMNGFKSEMIDRFLNSTAHVLLTPKPTAKHINLKHYHAFEFYPVQSVALDGANFIPLPIAAIKSHSDNNSILIANSRFNLAQVRIIGAVNYPMFSIPRSKSLKVINANMPAWQANYGYISFDLAKNLDLLSSHTLPNIAIILEKPQTAEFLAKKFNKQFPGWQAKSWQEIHSEFFRLIASQKSMMFLVLFFIIIIASFGLISGQVMLVQEKRREIAILTTLGFPYKSLISIYFVRGFFHGFIGLLFGLIVGLFVADNVTVIVNFIDNLSGNPWLTSALYGMDHMPSEIKLTDICQIFFSGLCLCIIAPLYPAFLVVKSKPIDVFRQLEGN